jgi:hypothetical protein
LVFAAMRVSFSMKATAVHLALTPSKVTVAVVPLKFTNSTGRPNRGTTAIPAPFALTAAALMLSNFSGKRSAANRS